MPTGKSRQLKSKQKNKDATALLEEEPLFWQPPIDGDDAAHDALSRLISFKLDHVISSIDDEQFTGNEADLRKSLSSYRGRFAFNIQQSSMKNRRSAFKEAGALGMEEAFSQGGQIEP